MAKQDIDVKHPSAAGVGDVEKSGRVTAVRDDDASVGARRPSAERAGSSPAVRRTKRLGVRFGRSRGRAWVLGTLGVVVCLVGWQIITSARLVDPLFLPKPSDTWHALVTYVGSAQIRADLKTSGEEFLIGLGLSIVLGVAVGVVYGLYAPVREFLMPMVIALNAMPQIAIVPLLILRFGVGIGSKIVMIIMMCIATILLNTATGMQVIDERFVRLSRSFGASRLQFLRTVALPSALPYVMTGIRICVGRALIGVVVGELFASKDGIGHLLVNSAANYNMPLLYAGLIVVTFFGIVLTQLIGVVEHRLQRWRE